MRVQWASEDLKKLWVPRISEIQNMLTATELWSVAHGMRRGAIAHAIIGGSGWHDLSTFAKEHNLVLTPFGVSSVEDYSNSVKPPTVGDPVMLRIFVSKEGVEVPRTDREWGEVLGYPECCREFFEEHWVKRGRHELGLYQCQSLVSAPISIPINVTHNILLRFLGVRPVFHLPCSYECAPTAEHAHKYKELSISLGFAEQYSWMLELLNQPFVVNSKNGIGEITHPFFRLMFDTDQSPNTWEVRFVAQKKENVRETNGFDSFWKDNGFTSFFAMEESHRRIIEQITGLNITSVLDLGAGNGLLVSRLGKILGADATAVEIDSHKCHRGKQIFPQTDFITADIRAVGMAADMVLISYNRFTEGVPYSICGMAKKYLVVYEYDDVDFSDLEFPSFQYVGSRDCKVRIYKRFV